MRIAHTPFYSALLLAMGALLSVPSGAQTHTAPPPASPAPAHVLDADAPTRPLVHQPLENSGSIVTTPGDWRKANAAVGEFPRGHADIVKWEAAAQSGKSDNAGKAAQPDEQGHHMHHSHGAKP